MADMKKPKGKAPASEQQSKNRTLRIKPVPGKTEDRMIADAAVGGGASNAMTLATFSRGTFGELSLTDCALALKEAAGAVNRGDLTAAETTLTAQAAALNAIFAEMARRAALNMGEHLPATEIYMRLALKAQSQCRATLETLAAIKNPPVVFARQANFASGPQQVNNGTAGTAPDSGTVGARAHTHAANSAIEPNELLEGLTHECTQLDPRAAPATGRRDTRLEAVGAVHRPAQP